MTDYRHDILGPNGLSKASETFTMKHTCDNKGGGVPDDMPVFTITMDDSVSPAQIGSITCNKTFDECAEYLNDADENDFASVAIVKYVHTSNPESVYYTTSAFGSRGAMEMIEYTINSGYRYSTEGIRYSYDGTLESFTPVELVTLNATANGTYTTGLTSRFYNEVNVNVDIPIPDPTPIYQIRFNPSDDVLEYKNVNDPNSTFTEVTVGDLRDAMGAVNQSNFLLTSEVTGTGVNAKWGDSITPDTATLYYRTYTPWSLTEGNIDIGMTLYTITSTKTDERWGPNTITYQEYRSNNS